MPVRRPRIAFAVLVGCALPVAAGAQSLAAPPVTRLLANLQAHYDRIADFSADFEHHYAGGVLRTTDVERGTMHVKKPRRWRFDYVDPEPKLFVCDGTTIHSWFPADRQVIVSPLPAGAGASTSAAFLAGEGDLLRDFTARYADGPPPDGAWSIELRPVAGGAGYESLILTVDRTTLDILEIATTDFQGGVSTYVLSNVMQNQGLSDSLFGFDVPADVEVIREEILAR